MGMMKEHDWVSENIANPNFTNTDFKTVGITAQNTSIGPESVYLKSATIQNAPEFQTNGRFDQNKFHKKYEELVVSYNKLASDTYEEDVTKLGKIFDYNNIFVSPEERMDAPLTYMTMEYNPDHISKGLTGINKLGPRTMTPMERAESLKIYDPSTGTYTENTPENSLFKNFFKPIVMATWDYDADINGNPTDDPAQIVYAKGEYKLNEDGEYYSEFLNGRSPYNKQIIAKWNILTPEGSFLNSLDMFDSDGIDKSTGGSIMRNALKIAPFFVPQIAPFYAAASLGINLVESLGTLGKLIEGSENETLNNITAFAQSFNLTTSEYGQQHTFSLENIINMVGDTFSFLRSQKILAEQAPKFFLGKAPTNKAEFDKEVSILANDWMGKRKRALTYEFNKAVETSDALRMQTILRNMDEEQLKLAANVIATKSVLNQAAAYLKLGRQISTSTMAITFGLHTYGHAKAQGVSDAAATALTLGAIAGQYALLSSHIGQHIFPDAQILNKRLETAINKMFVVEEGTNKTLAQASKEMQILKGTGANGDVLLKQEETLNLMLKGWNLAKEMWNVQSTPTKATLATTVAQGVEMMSFSVLDDVIASVYNLSQYVSGKDHRMSAWDDMLGRYGTSLIGGAVAGAMGASKIYKEAKSIREMNNDQAYLTIIYMLDLGKRDELFKTIDKLELGNKYLSGTKQYQIFDQQTNKNIVYWDMGTPEDNQDLLAKNTLKLLITNIDNILTSHGAKISKNSILEELVDNKNLLSAYRFDALLLASVTKSYIEDFISNQYELVKNGLLISNNPEIRSRLGKTDAEVRAVDKEIKENEGKAKSAEAEEQVLARLNLEENIKKNKLYASGEIAKDFIRDALYELTTELHMGLLPEGFRNFVRDIKKEEKDLEQLDEAHRKAYWEDYTKQLYGVNRPRHMRMGRELFDKINKNVQPRLKKGLVLQSEKASKILEPFVLEMLRALPREVAKDSDEGGLENIQLLHQFLYKAVLGHLIEKYDKNEKISELGKAINELASTDLEVYARNLRNFISEYNSFDASRKATEPYDETLLDRLEDVPTLFKEIREVQKTLAEKLAKNPSDTETQAQLANVSNFIEDAITIDGLDRIMDQLHAMYYIHLRESVLPKFYEDFSNNYKEMGFVDYDLRINILNFIDSLNKGEFLNARMSVQYAGEGKPYDVKAILQNILPNNRKAGEMSQFEKSAKALDDYTTPADTNSIFKEFYTLLRAKPADKLDILNLDDWQIINTLDSVLKDLDGEKAFSVTNLFNSIENQYKDLETRDAFFKNPSIDIEKFILDPDTVENLTRVLQVLNLLDSTLVAATQEINSSIDMFGYNATVNEILKLTGDDALVTISANEVGVRRESLDNIRLRLLTLKQISNLAQTLKWSNIPRIDLKFESSVYKQLVQKIEPSDSKTNLEDITFEDGTKFEGVQELRDSLNLLAVLKNGIENTGSITDDDINAGLSEFILMAKIWNKFVTRNEAIFNDPKKASAFINKENFNNLGWDVSKYKGITQYEEPVDDMALLYLLGTFASLDPDVFWSTLGEVYPDLRIPAETQHIIAYLQLAHIVGNGMETKFALAYNESLKYDEDGKPYDLTTLEGKIQYIKKVAASDKLQKYLKVHFTEGSPGFGKSGGVLPLTIRMLYKLSPGSLKNAWIFKPSNPKKDIIDKSGIAQKDLDELKIQTFEGNEGRIKLMRNLMDNYLPPVIDPNTRTLVVDLSKEYKFNFETNGLEYPDKQYKTIAKEECPKVIFIDEFTDSSEEEWFDINQAAEINNIKVIAVGDFFQSGVNGFINKVTYDGVAITSDTVPWGLLLRRGNTKHTYAGQFSFRTDNILIDLDLPTLKNARTAFKDSIINSKEYVVPLHHYTDKEVGLTGTMIDLGINEEDFSPAEDLDPATIIAVKNMITDVINSNGKKQIVYVYSPQFEVEGTKSPMYKLLEESKTDDGRKYSDFITYQKGTTIKGDEAAYYIIDQDLVKPGMTEGELDAVAAEWYTGLTRAKQGSIFIDRITNNFYLHPDDSKSSPFVFKRVTQKSTRKITIPERVEQERRAKYLTNLSNKYEQVVEFVPSQEEAATSPAAVASAAAASPVRQESGGMVSPTDPETGVRGEILEIIGTPEETTDGTGTNVSLDILEGNTNSDSLGVVINETIANFIHGPIYDVTFIDPVDAERQIVIKVNAKLEYGVYPFRAQRTGYRTDNPNERDGRNADGYSVCKDYRSDCVYGLRRIAKYKNPTAPDPYDIEGKSPEDKREIIDEVIRQLESLRNAALYAKTEEQLLQEFLILTGLNRKGLKPKDVYIREAIIKKNPRLVENSTEPTSFQSVAADFNKELSYGASNLLRDGNDRTNEIARTEYVVIFGLKGNGRPENNPGAAVLLTLPLAGLPNWETIVLNSKFSEKFRNKYYTLKSRYIDDGVGLAKQFLYELLLAINNPASLTGDELLLATILNKILQTYLNISTTVSLFPAENRIPISRRIKATGPFIINNDRGQVSLGGNLVDVEGLILKASNIHSKLTEESAKPHWHFSKVVTPVINENVNTVKYFINNGKKVLKAGVPYVFVTKLDRTPIDISYSGGVLKAGNAWTDEAMIRYYMEQIQHPEIPQLVKKIALDTPGVTVELYIEAMKTALFAKEDKESKRKSQDMGNAFTAYRIILKLYLKFGDDPSSAFSQIISRSTLLGTTFNLTWEATKAKLDKLADIESRNPDDYVEKVRNELEGFLVVKKQNGEDYNIRWRAGFLVFLNRLFNFSIVSSGDPNDAENLYNKLLDEVRLVTKEWRTGDGTENIIHYNLAFELSGINWSKDNYLISFREITNVDEENPYMMHNKSFTFRGVLMDGPALGEISSLYDFILKSYNLTAPQRARLPQQSNSSHTQTYDQANKTGVLFATPGGSLLPLSNKKYLTYLWNHNREGTIFYKREYEAEIDEIISNSEAKIVHRYNHLTGEESEYQLADINLRDKGFLTIWDRDKIYIVKLAGNDVFEGYKVTDVRITDPFNPSKVKKEKLIELHDLLYPDKTADPSDVKINRLQSEHSGNNNVKPIVINLEKEGESFPILGLWNKEPAVGESSTIQIIMKQARPESTTVLPKEEYLNKLSGLFKARMTNLLSSVEGDLTKEQIELILENNESLRRRKEDALRPFGDNLDTDSTCTITLTI